MGTLKIQMGGYLRERILGNTPIFQPVTEQTLQREFDGRPVKLKTGDPESRIEVRQHPKGLEATFIYPLDSDPEASNGSLYAEDKFIYNPETKEFDVHRSVRMGSGAAGDAAWGELFGKLKETETGSPLDRDDPAVKKFFNEGVLALPAPLEGEEAPGISFASSSSSVSPSPTFMAEASLTTLVPYSGLKNSEIFAACLQEGISFLLASDASERRKNSAKSPLTERSKASSISQLCRAVDRGVGEAAEGITGRAVLGALWVGGASFRAGEALFFNRDLRVSYPLVSRVLGALTGMALEARTLEITHRRLEGEGSGSNPFNPWRWGGEGGLKQGLLRSYATFGVFRSSHGVLNAAITPAVEAGFQPFGAYTAPVLAHSGSFATLHAVNEWERKVKLRESEGPWAVRLASDAAFYGQMLVVGGLIETATGPKVPNAANFSPRKPAPEPPPALKTGRTEADLPAFPEPPLTLPPESPASGAEAPPPTGVADRRSYPPPKSFPFLEVT